MRECNFCVFVLCVLGVTGAPNLFAQNPIIRDQFTADPSARVLRNPSRREKAECMSILLMMFSLAKALAELAGFVRKTTTFSLQIILAIG